MYKNQDGNFVYLVVPEKYKCVYDKLLIKMSDLGIDMIKDCGATCRGINRHVINCWNMFNSACAAYSIGEEKKADLMINYINAQLRLNCPYYCTDESKPTITDFSLEIDYTEGDTRAYINTAIFTLTNDQNVRPNSLCIHQINCGNKIIIFHQDIHSPVNVGSVPFVVQAGIEYKFMATVKDRWGNVIESNHYTWGQEPTPEPTEETYYYGSGEAPDNFDKASSSTSTEIDFTPQDFKLWVASKDGKKPYSILSNPDSVFEHEEYDEQYVTTKTVGDYTAYTYDYGALMTFPVRVKLQ